MVKRPFDHLATSTKGVSIATITSIERHLSSDVHRKLPPELVEERNKVLKGEASV